MTCILVVEPQASAVKSLEPLLHGIGCRIEIAREGVEAIDKARVLKPDLVMMDFQLPGMSSYETCKKLKQDRETGNIPVMFFEPAGSGESMPEPMPLNGKLAEAFEHGAIDFISLSKDAREITARINGALRMKRSINQSEALAAQLNELNSELYQRNLQVEKELYVARQLQQSLLPPYLPEEQADYAAQPVEMRFSRCHYRDENLRISGIYLPCDALGGDIYDVIKFQNGSVGVAVADVSGHGVPAGFITAIFKASFYRMTHMYQTPGDILYHLNNELADIVKTGDYITAIYCRVEPDTRKVEYTGAGHPYPMYYSAADKTLKRLEENGSPLVWFKDMDYPMGEITLAPGDKLLVFTDGISEIKNPERDLLGEEKLEALFVELVEKHPTQVLDKLIETLSDYTQGHPLEDDMSLVLIESL